MVGTSAFMTVLELLFNRFDFLIIDDCFNESSPLKVMSTGIRLVGLSIIGVSTCLPVGFCPGFCLVSI